MQVTYLCGQQERTEPGNISLHASSSASLVPLCLSVLGVVADFFNTKILLFFDIGLVGFDYQNLINKKTAKLKVLMIYCNKSQGMET